MTGSMGSRRACGGCPHMAKPVSAPAGGTVARCAAGAAGGQPEIKRIEGSPSPGYCRGTDPRGCGSGGSIGEEHRNGTEPGRKNTRSHRPPDTPPTRGTKRRPCAAGHAVFFRSADRIRDCSPTDLSHLDQGLVGVISPEAWCCTASRSPVRWIVCIRSEARR